MISPFLVHYRPREGVESNQNEGGAGKKGVVGDKNILGSKFLDFWHYPVWPGRGDANFGGSAS